MYKLLVDWDFPKENFSYLTFFSFGLAEILSDTVHGWFPQRQCCKHTIWENTDQCCPYDNSTPGHSTMKMSLFRSSLPLWLWVYYFLPFSLLSKSLNDFKWFAMTGKTCFGSATLKSAQNFRPEKKFVEGEWWTVGGVWRRGYCAYLRISSSLGSSPGWGHCAVFWDTTLYSLSTSLSTRGYINGCWLT